jgi:hypothetical protein
MFKALSLLSLLTIAPNLYASCTAGDPVLHLDNSISCSGGAQNQAVIFSLGKAKSNQEYYISGQANDCGGFPAYLWEEIDSKGNVIATTDAQKEIILKKDKSYQMRVLIDEPTCSNYDLWFNLERL